MKKLMTLMGTAALGLSALAFGTSAKAQNDTPVPVSITVDEQGHGFYSIDGGTTILLTAIQQTDPGPGGLPGALTYVIPFFGIIPGDVLLTEDGAEVSDLIRFNTGAGEVYGTLVFYSDNGDGADALADIGLPEGRYTNVLTLAESGPEGDNGAFYTPMNATQPGLANAENFLITYHFISDATEVPEPATWALMLCGFSAAGLAVRRRRKRAHQRWRLSTGAPGRNGSLSKWDGR